MQSRIAVEPPPPTPTHGTKLNCAKRRTDYAPRTPVEQFIVPLVKANVEAMLAEHANADTAAGVRRVLDVGCGRQPFRVRLERLGFAYTGMDVVQSPENNVDVVGPVDGPLPPDLLARGPYELVLCTEVMEHVAHWDRALTNLFEVTAAGGKVLITCPFFYPLHEEPYDYWRPTYHGLRACAERAGFRMISYTESGDGWDILGTTLAHCALVTPASRTLTDRAVSKVCRVAKDLMVRLLRTRWIQRHAHLGGRVYMSNAVVLERPASEAADDTG